MRLYRQQSTSKNILLIKTAVIFLSPRPIAFSTGADVAVAAAHCALVYRSVTSQSLSGDVDASPAGFSPSRGICPLTLTYLLTYLLMLDCLLLTLLLDQLQIAVNLLTRFTI